MHLRDFGDVLVAPLVRKHGGFLEAHGLRSCDQHHYRIGYPVVKQGATTGVRVAAHGAAFGKVVDKSVLERFVPRAVEVWASISSGFFPSALVFDVHFQTQRSYV